MKKLFLLSLLILVPLTLAAQTPTNDKNIEEVIVEARKQEIKKLPGSAYLVDTESLEKFDYTDLNRVLNKVPGLYIREEDGYGLRPNIGIRGVTSDRSQKITLMEDEILITPAPYSAPAAYYVPNISKISSVEIFKGTAASLYGPHTVGGSVNLITRQVTDEDNNEIDLSLGSDDFYKTRLFAQRSHNGFGYWIEALAFGSSGFKELDGGGDTGFDKTDINARLQWRFGENYKQTFDVKLGYAEEDSNETYLGLTDEDFAANPNRRYRASELDNFTSDHQQLHFIHDIEISDSLSINTKAYVNNYFRSWNKFDGFINSTTSARDVFIRPDQNGLLLDLLRGDIDSTGLSGQQIDITDNEREFSSRGIEVKALKNIRGENTDHQITAGIRIHNDYVERHHQQRAYDVVGGTLVQDQSFGVQDKALNRGETDALSLYVYDKLLTGKWEITGGLRYEKTDFEFEDFDNSSRSNSGGVSEVLPSFGVLYKKNAHLSLLAGINKGFSPVSPSPSSGEDSVPEESINVEYGFRYNKDELRLEAIGFYNDYSNLLGRCRASDGPSCDIGQEFNGGAIEVVGLELLSQYQYHFDTISIPLSFSYTFTQAEFQTSFVSDFSQWGIVNAGDSLPYLPENTWRFETGVIGLTWEVIAAINFVDEMLDLPEGNPGVEERTDALTTLDLAASWFAQDNLRLQFTVDNVLDEQSIVSFRPFGARPTKPRTAILTAKWVF